MVRIRVRVKILRLEAWAWPVALICLSLLNRGVRPKTIIPSMLIFINSCLKFDLKQIFLLQKIYFFSIYIYIYLKRMDSRCLINGLDDMM